MRGFIQSVSRLRAHALTQLAATGALSAIVGFTLQITKLSAIDSSGRQFDQGTYAGKVGFLAVFGVSKAFANLSVGWLVTRLGYVRTELAGWVLGLAMPLTLALTATAGADGATSGAAGAAGWRAVMFANVVLGLQQGLCWSVTVLVMILLMPDTRRGLASGLNETLGYAAVASAAPVYGILESRLVRCGWALPVAQLSAACRAAARSLLGGAVDPNAAGDPNITALPAPDLDPGACTSPDTWDPACLGECRCRGYDRLMIGALLVLLPSGMAVTALLLVEPSPAAAYLPVSAAAVDEVRMEDDEHKAGSFGGGGGVASRDLGDGAPARRGPRAWLEALRQSLAGSMPYDAGGYGISYRHLPPEQAPETRRLLARASPPAEAAGPSSSASGGASHASKDMELASLDGRHPPPDRFQQPGDRPAGPQTAVSLSVDGRRQSLPAPSSSGAPCGGAGGAGHGRDWLSSAARFGSAFLHYSWHNPSTAAMCLAGATSNALTSLAWGLLLTWARDSLGVPGPGRNLITAAYSFLKGLVQLLSGAASDAAGRKAPVLVGLTLNAAGLLTCACGAGWGGRLLGLGSSGAGGSEAAAQRLLLVQYGYLVLGSCLMGAGAGVFYPVMPAAVVDHHARPVRHQDFAVGAAAADGDVDEGEVGSGGIGRPPARGQEEHRGGVVAGEHSVAAAMATYRFWRDLGYALGALGGPVADVVGVEATLLVAAAACLAVAGVVLVRYEEQVPVAAAVVASREQRCDKADAQAAAVVIRRRG